MTQQVTQENLSLVQKLYTQISNELKAAALEHVQLNKRLPYSVIQRID